LFKTIRFAENNGEPVCIHCGCVAVYTYKCRPKFKCKGCMRQFSLTSGTVFASRKMPVRDILYAIAEFVEGAKGVSAMYLQRKLQCEYKTAWVLQHKLREAMSRDVGPEQLRGSVEFDGAVIGGYVKPKNAHKSKSRKTGKEKANARRLPPHIGPKKLCVFVTRERGPRGRIRTTILRDEAHALPFIRSKVLKGSELHSDKKVNFNTLVKDYNYHRINHTHYYWTPECSTNLAENYFSMLIRGMRGVYHHISHPAYAHAYSEEMAWRLVYKRQPNLEKFESLIHAAARHPTTRFRGMWQKRSRGNEIVLLR